MVQASSVIELCAALLLAFCATFGVPITWPKLQLGSALRWIGWRLNLRAQVFSVPPEKLAKLVIACVAVLEHRTTTKKALQSLLGLLHWLLHVAPILKPWLSCRQQTPRSTSAVERGAAAPEQMSRKIAAGGSGNGGGGGSSTGAEDLN